MNREELSRQLNEDIPVKTSAHQVWLKSQLERRGYFQVAKKKMVGRRFDFSFMNVKKLVPLMGVAFFAVMAVVLWNPLVSKLGGRPTMTYAQEMLRLTAEQIATLTPEQQKILAMQVQEGLTSVWEKAQNSKDLQFFSGKESCISLVRDMALISDSKQKSVDFDDRCKTANKNEASFRFSDHEGIITYIQLFNLGNGTSGEEKFITEKSAIWVIRLTEKDTVHHSSTSSDQPGLVRGLKFSSQQRDEFRKKIEERLRSFYPDIWKEVVSSPTSSFTSFDELHPKQEEVSGQTIQVINGEELQVREPVPSRPIVLDFSEDVAFDGGFKWIAWVLEYHDSQNHRVTVRGKFKAESPYEFISPLRIFRYK